MYYTVHEFLLDVGVLDSNIRLNKVADTRWTIEIFGIAVFRYKFKSLWIINFLVDGDDVFILGERKCSNNWKNDFWRMLPIFIKYIRQ